MPEPTLFSKIEAVLFVSGEPLAFARLAKILGTSKKEVLEGVQALQERLSASEEAGLSVIVNGEAVELATKKEHAPLLEALAKSTLQERLSQAALEVLAIVAYRAPITRAHIEAIRGVNCSFTLRNLLLRGLIDRRENPDDAREYVYEPSFAFLEKLGLGSVKNLPEYAALSRDARLDMVLETEGSSETNKNTRE